MCVCISACATVVLYCSCLQPILVGFVTKGSPRVAKLSIRCIHSVYSETDLLVDRQMKVIIHVLDVHTYMYNVHVIVNVIDFEG